MLNENMLIEILKHNFDYILNNFGSENINYNDILNAPLKEVDHDYFDISFGDFELFEGGYRTVLPYSIQLSIGEKVKINIPGYIPEQEEFSPATEVILNNTFITINAEFFDETDTSVGFTLQICDCADMISTDDGLSIIKDVNKTCIVILPNSAVSIETIKMSGIKHLKLNNYYLENTVEMNNAVVLNQLDILGWPTQHDHAVTKGYLDNIVGELDPELFLESISNTEYMYYDLDFSKNNLPVQDFGTIAKYISEDQLAFTPYYILEYTTANGESKCICQENELTFNNTIPDIVRLRLASNVVDFCSTINLDFLEIADGVNYYYTKNMDSGDFYLVDTVNNMSYIKYAQLYGNSSPRGLLVENKALREIDTIVLDSGEDGLVMPYSAFYNCSNLKKINNLVSIGSPKAFESTFYGCASLEEIDFANFDTSKVTRLYHTFGYCTSLKSIKNFDVSSVSYTYGPFAYGGNQNLRYVELLSSNPETIKKVASTIPNVYSGSDVYTLDISKNSQEVRDALADFTKDGWTIVK